MQKVITMDQKPGSGTSRRNNKFGQYLGIALLMIFIVIILTYVFVDYATATIDELTRAISAGIFGIAVTEIVAHLLYKYSRTTIIKSEARTLANLFRITAYSALALIILSILNINITGLLISAGFLGIVLGLAAQSTLGNFIAGLSLLIARPFYPDDYVTIITWQYGAQPPSFSHSKFVPGYVGTIDNIGLMYTKIIDESGTPVYIPNNIVNQSLVLNHKRAKDHPMTILIEVPNEVKPAGIEEKTRKFFADNGMQFYEDTVKVEYAGLSSYMLTVILRVNDHRAEAQRLKLYKELIDYISMAKGDQKGKSQKSLAAQGKS